MYENFVVNGHFKGYSACVCYLLAASVGVYSYTMIRYHSLSSRFVSLLVWQRDRHVSALDNGTAGGALKYIEPNWLREGMSLTEFSFVCWRTLKDYAAVNALFNPPPDAPSGLVGVRVYGTKA